MLRLLNLDRNALESREHKDDALQSVASFDQLQRTLLHILATRFQHEFLTNVSGFKPWKLLQRRAKKLGIQARDGRDTPGENAKRRTEYLGEVSEKLEERP